MIIHAQYKVQYTRTKASQKYHRKNIDTSRAALYTTKGIKKLGNLNESDKKFWRYRNL